MSRRNRRRRRSGSLAGLIVHGLELLFLIVLLVILL